MLTDRIRQIQWAMDLAEITSRRSTCYRRGVGCIIFDNDFRVLSTGYNGVAAKQPHCNSYYFQGTTIVYPYRCSGHNAKSGTKLDDCAAVHAEQNALVQCQSIDRITYCVITTAPCVSCTKLLLNTPCKTVIYKHSYPNDGMALWTNSGRNWVSYHTLLE